MFDERSVMQLKQQTGIMKKPREISAPVQQPKAAVPRLILVDSTEFQKTAETTGK